MLLTMLTSRWVAHRRGPIRPGAPMRQAAFDEYYEGVKIIPEETDVSPVRS
jgi:hypothetical protein